MYLFCACVRDHLFKVASFTTRIAPIAWPIAKLLDFALGADTEHTYKKAELKSFLQFHRTGEEPLRDVEIAILNGVLELNSKNVEEIMTPLKVETSGCVHRRLYSYFSAGYSGVECQYYP